MNHRNHTAPFHIWGNPTLRIVSCHPEEGFDLPEFWDQTLFFRCIDEYSRQRYRYQ